MSTITHYLAICRKRYMIEPYACVNSLGRRKPTSTKKTGTSGTARKEHAVKSWRESSNRKELVPLTDRTLRPLSQGRSRSSVYSKSRITSVESHQHRWCVAVSSFSRSFKVTVRSSR